MNRNINKINFHVIIDLLWIAETHFRTVGIDYSLSINQYIIQNIVNMDYSIYSPEYGLTKSLVSFGLIPHLYRVQQARILRISKPEIVFKGNDKDFKNQVIHCTNFVTFDSNNKKQKFKILSLFNFLSIISFPVIFFNWNSQWLRLRTNFHLLLLEEGENLYGNT